MAGAAVFSARLAARTANERQQAQLDADFERLKAELAEERRLRSDERTRDSIDALVIGVHDTMDKLAALGVPAQGGEETRAELRQAIAAADGAAKETYEKELRRKERELWEASIALVDQSRGTLALETSAQLRLPAKGPVIRAYKEFKRSVNAYREKLMPLITQSLSDDARAELKAGHDDLEKALHNLMESCHGGFLKAAGSVPIG